MTSEDIEHKVSAFLIETLEIDASLIKSDASLKNDIGISSLDAVELRMFINNTFGYQLTRDDMLSIDTMDELYTLIGKHL